MDQQIPKLKTGEIQRGPLKCNGRCSLSIVPLCPVLMAFQCHCRKVGFLACLSIISPAGTSRLGIFLLNLTVNWL